MLNAFAIEFAQEFFDLAAAAFAFFVQRNADLTIRGRQRLRGQPRIFALDIEVADFLKVKELLINISPICHPPAIHIVRQMIDNLEAAALWVLVHTRQRDKINVVNIQLIAITVG